MIIDVINKIDYTMIENDQVIGNNTYILDTMYCLKKVMIMSYFDIMQVLCL